MDSIVGIAKGIANLDCEPEIKECLQALMNLELMSSAGNPVTKLTYSREIEMRFENWNSPTEQVEN